MAVILSREDEECREYALETCQERLQEIKEMRGIKENTAEEENYIVNRKGVIWSMKYAIDDLLYDLKDEKREFCFSEQEHNDIKELLEKLSSRLEEIDNTLENIFEQIILQKYT